MTNMRIFFFNTVTCDYNKKEADANIQNKLAVTSGERNEGGVEEI